jgi:hypothetical protein
MCDPGLAQPGLFGGVLVGLWTVVSEDLIPGLSAEWPSPVLGLEFLICERRVRIP